MIKSREKGEVLMNISRAGEYSRSKIPMNICNKARIIELRGKSVQSQNTIKLPSKRDGFFNDIAGGPKTAAKFSLAKGSSRKRTLSL